MAGNERMWKPVTKKSPCPACGHADWCAWTPDGDRLKCERTNKAPTGMKKIKDSDGGALFTTTVRDDRPSRSSRTTAVGASAKRVPIKACSETINWKDEIIRHREAFSEIMLSQLAQALHVTPSSLSAINIGWVSRERLGFLKASGAGWANDYPDGAFSFPERNGRSAIVGLSLRATDGRKGSPSSAVGAARGLIVPLTLKDRCDPVLIVEGASDVAACESLHLAAVGRPSNTSGADDLAQLLDGRDVLVVGERDGKPDGRWPGRDGAKSIANRLATSWQQAVRWTLPPTGIKDIRVWLQDRVSKGLDLSDADACSRAGAEMLAVLKSDSKEVPCDAKPRQAERIVQLAMELLRLGRSDDGESIAIAHEQPGRALSFRHDEQVLRSLLARNYRRTVGSTPTAPALNDALNILRGEAMDLPQEKVHLRVAQHRNNLVLDLGGDNGKAVIINPGEWVIVDESPVLFRRTVLTQAMPEPNRSGSVGLLKDLLNVTEDCWPVLLGWMVSAFIPDMPHPILLIGGQQGSGKSTAARMILDLIDPSPAPLRTQPTNEEDWSVGASGGWAIGVDNISTIAPWWSDALCKASTGDARVSRQRFTDCGLTVIKFRRMVLLTSIDPGALRGDLGDRLLLMDLQPIDETQRRPESELDQMFQANRSVILGGLLDLVAGVLAYIGQVKLKVLPRMADFARILAALDMAFAKSDGDLGGRALNCYLRQRTWVAQEIIESDAVACAITELVENKERWNGTIGELLKQITPLQRTRDWPDNPRKLRAHLNRIQPALKQIDIIVKIPETRTREGRVITIEHLRKRQSQPSQRSHIEDAGASCG